MIWVFQSISAKNKSQSTKKGKITSKAGVSSKPEPKVKMGNGKTKKKNTKSEEKARKKNSEIEMF